MTRVNFVGEGQTEEAFVNQVLGPHLANHGIPFAVRQLGGLRDWNKAANFVHRWMREDRNPNARFTTLLDLYGLPANTPGRAEAVGGATPWQRCHRIEVAIGNALNNARFMPYVQLHEFEALVLVNASELTVPYPGHAAAASRLTALASQYRSPEEINEGPTTSPSKRIIDVLPVYSKVVSGPSAVGRIGLPTVRRACPHFGAWLSCLESLATDHPMPWPTLVSAPESNT